MIFNTVFQRKCRIIAAEENKMMGVSGPVNSPVSVSVPGLSFGTSQPLLMAFHPTKSVEMEAEPGHCFNS